MAPLSLSASRGTEEKLSLRKPPSMAKVDHAPSVSSAQEEMEQQWQASDL